MAKARMTILSDMNIAAPNNAPDSFPKRKASSVYDDDSVSVIAIIAILVLLLDILVHSCINQWMILLLVYSVIPKHVAYLFCHP